MRATSPLHRSRTHAGARETCAFLIVGGGVVGLAVALEIKRRQPGARTVLIEKESSCGQHASGRNSGVLHAGFYYSADSLKARFTRDGNRRLTEYCEERGLRIRRCGKLVVTRSERDLPALEELLRRGEAAGVALEEVTAAEARSIEPRARTHERALFSPATASIDPAEVVASLVADARRSGVVVKTGCAYAGRRAGLVRTTSGTIDAGYVINAAGLYADRVARDFGFSERYRILPFKGLYLYSLDGDGGFRTHVYPVPDLRYPFLGVHFTLTVDGLLKVGPTAVPALWREHYGGARGFRFGEFLEIAGREARLLASDAIEFRALAWREMAKRSKRRLVALASELATEPLNAARWRWGRPGIRAQLYDVQASRLEMDFRFEGDDRSFHVLNAVSPAFTSALPFAEHVMDEIERLVSGGGARAPMRLGVGASRERIAAGAAPAGAGGAE